MEGCGALQWNIKMDKKRTTTAIVAAAVAIAANASGTTTLRIIGTSDVHGAFFAQDPSTGKGEKGNLAKVASMVERLRAEHGRNLILLDNGDILQGKPANYYYNFVDTLAVNIAARAVNLMGYDAQGVGNHDIETGHGVYDKWAGEVDAPMLCANAVDAATGLPYFTPYTIMERDGCKIAILGLTTPAVPHWLAPQLWSGLRFEDMLSSARHWMEEITRKEKPDVTIGLFHSGLDGGISTPSYEENAVADIAELVPGFDAIFFGHDHTPLARKVCNAAGDSVLLLNPGAGAANVCDATITISKDGKGNTIKTVEGKLASAETETPHPGFTAAMEECRGRVAAFISEPIGRITRTISTRDSYFGPSAFGDLIHNLQLGITGADISLSAPLSFNAEIKEGDITVGDMFSLYKYENQLCVMELTGNEILGHLEMSYSLWANTMASPGDHLLLLSEDTRADGQRMGFANLAFNFDSAAGIDYEVDATKPPGQKVSVKRMSSGEPFLPGKTYKVALNSYRANGGGELLTRGAGIPQDSLQSRITWQSGRDLRHYLMEEIRRQGTISPKANGNWRFVPEEWTRPAAERDRKLLFGNARQ